MKKKSHIILMLLLLITIAIISIISINNKLSEDQQVDLPEHYILDAKTPAFETLDEMEDYSDLIVKGIRQSNEETFITTNNGNIISGYTFSTFVITDIYKDTSNKLKSDDIITILENEIYDKTANKVYHVAGYKMMVENNDYLLFLKANIMNGLDYYVSAGVNYGTISLLEDNRNVPILDKFNENIYQEYEYYYPIWEDAKRKYTY